MSEGGKEETGPARQPVFLVPGVVTALVGALWAVHLGASLVLDSEGLYNLRIWFGFIPFRFVAPELLPGGFWPLLWTGFTHAFLHVDVMHLIVNSAWLAVFGTPVARRYGSGATLAVFLLGALAGALLNALHQLIDVNQFVVLIGASGGVSALTGAALRFIFQPLIVKRDPETGEAVVMGRRTATFAELFTNVRSRVFIIFWLGGNLVVGFAPLVMGVDVPIAWDAHIGGFIAGLLLPAAFDRRLRAGAGR
ncbi:rhomboid family intramembrane serine protease [Pelagibacterium xiamenense]|uniref:rhomboid family intramembrane serine protease n=1 Tax=Pelagibacterium xiamenense TaxID=2901140 RepID=UPI001E347FEA|nr:rhomboid family intramembrane serine protease [Pelagibacterium xiamenense]MCD7059910.1 rhomboid family intramembrane serine protease [Pelagibacterium xiamenense]